MTDESASVILFRPKKLMGFAIAPPVECDGKPVAKRMQSSRYMALHLAPGHHVIRSHRKENADWSWELPIDVESGRTYFVSCSFGGLWGTAIEKTGVQISYKKDDSGESMTRETFTTTIRGLPLVVSLADPTAAKKALRHMKPASNNAVADTERVSLAKLAIQ
jgi:Protein of unknown function (DUF2846)